MNKIQCGWRSLKGPQRAVVWTHRAQDSLLSGGKEADNRKFQGSDQSWRQGILSVSHRQNCLFHIYFAAFSWTLALSLPVPPAAKFLLTLVELWKPCFLEPLPCVSGRMGYFLPSVTQGRKLKGTEPVPTQQRPPKSESRQQNVGPMIKNTYWAPIKICILIIAFENTDL